MSDKNTLDNINLTVLNEVYVPRYVTKRDTISRSGIITDIVRENNKSIAVILWDNDHPTEVMAYGNDDNSFEDLTVKGAVDKEDLEIIVNTNKYELDVKGEYY